jgi:hypothetical protein
MASVLHDVQHRDADHPDGWMVAQKSALEVIAEAANYKTGLMKTSMLTLAEVSGIGEQTLRRAAGRALDEGLIVMEGYFMGKSRVLRFPNPMRIGEPVTGTGSNRSQVPDQPGGQVSDPVVDPVSDPVTDTDIPVVPVVPADVVLTTTARPHRKATTAAREDGDGYLITDENVGLIFGAWCYQLRYGRRVELTTARRDVICHALRERRGTVEQIREAIVNVASACPDRENQRCTDLPHILHRDRLVDAIADDIDPDDWTSSPFGDGAY